MQAAVLSAPAPISQSPLKIEDVPAPEPKPGHVLLKVLACGVCRTDLHIVEGELPPRMPRVIPGHQIVGEIIAGDISQTATGATLARVATAVIGRPAEHGSTATIRQGTLVSVSWIGGTDGTCAYCRR